MIKLNLKEDKIVLVTESKEMNLHLSDSKAFKCIVANLTKMTTPCKFSLETVSTTESYLILNGQIKILLSELAANEIIGHMILLNKKFSVPKETIEESD